MARAAVLLDRGGRVGARPVVRRVLDRAAPELLGELAADLGLGEEDRPAAARRPAEVLYRVSPRGSAVRVRPVPAPGRTRPVGASGTWPTPAGRRGGDGGGEVASYLATPGRGRRRPGPRRTRPRLLHRL